ncbi:hypothetical protein C448_12966 [Halococcus morrhuae DSM 1307]|uniref:Uncharacterized protein n=1 Tax=Halococcus morrhuae DSM 1307 TaxID=931277 RepID=M0M7B0_HALMO|nr:hypothetical protein C448_12966 [Halococcus morrhuae DSM 1307]
MLVGMGSGCAGLLAGCLGAGEGKYARRIAINGSPTAAATEATGTAEATGATETTGATEFTETTDAPTSQGLVLLDHEFYRDGSGGVRGRTENRGDVDLDFIAAHARFFDRSGTDIGRASDSQSDFAVGETWAFDAQALDTDPANVARYQLVLIDQRSSEVDPFASTS